MKVFFRRIHLYLSLAAGLVILIACLTGAILVFEKDIQQALNPKRYFVAAAGTRLPLEQLAEHARAAYPGTGVSSIKLYEDGERSAELAMTLAQKGGPAPGGRAPGFTLFLNPYTGAVLEKYSYRETWFYTVFALHRWLLGGEGSVGKYIVGISTLLFLFIILTGIVLWWPATRRVLAQRLRIKWSGGWKRLNHDLHIVLGFYSAIFLFVFAFTALAWSFEWFNKGIYTVTNSPQKPPPPPRSAGKSGATIPLEQALATARTVYPAAVYYTVGLPKGPSDAITVTALGRQAAHETATDAVYIDRYTGAVTGKLPFGGRSLGARVRSTFRPVHTGSIWGLPSKIVAFVVCLFGASFPVTGVIMWLNRTRKKRKGSVAPAARAEVG